MRRVLPSYAATKASGSRAVNSSSQPDQVRCSSDGQPGRVSGTQNTLYKGRLHSRSCARISRHIGGSVRCYQELSASLAAWQSRLRLIGKLARLHIYASAPLIQLSAFAADRGRAPRARQGLWPRHAGQPCTVNSASRGRGLMGKPVTESNLSLCVPAQIPADLAPLLVVRLAIGSAPELLICRSLPSRVADLRRGEPVPGRGTAALTIVQLGTSGAPARRGRPARRRVLAPGGAGLQPRPKPPRPAIPWTGSTRSRTGIEPADDATRRPPVSTTGGPPGTRTPPGPGGDRHCGSGCIAAD
jgi:hypothetical protein